MQFPRRSTRVFSLMETLYEMNGATFEEVIAEVGYLSSRQTNHEMKKMFQALLDQGYAVKYNEKYKLTEDAFNYVVAVLKMEGTFKSKEVVQPAYKNVFTPEMKNYDSKLFANKRGY